LDYNFFIMVKVCVLASGSKGNSTYISDGVNSILVDFGKSYREISSLLSEIGASIKDIDAVLITHEHSDHVKGLVTLLKNHPDLPIISHPLTLMEIDMKYELQTVKNSLDGFGNGFCIGNIKIQPFRISHDAICPVGYSFLIGQHHIATATDLGYVSDAVRTYLTGAEMVILESNHDEEMLINGNYDYRLKKRIMGKEGHLSNDTSSDFAAELAEKGTKTFILAHLSEENNLPDLAYSACTQKLSSSGFVVGTDVNVEIAKQNEKTSVFVLD